MKQAETRDDGRGGLSGDRTGPVHGGRVRLLNDRTEQPGPVIYWMSRDQRVNDNWALILAQHLADAARRPLHAAFCLRPSFLGATLRQYRFMLRGLREVESGLGRLNITFHLLRGEPAVEITALARKLRAGTVVGDFSPLAPARAWRTQAAALLPVPLYEVDTHNVVPCRLASSKQEYAAATIRPKIFRHLEEFLVEFPVLEEHRWGRAVKNATDWADAETTLRVDREVGESDWLTPGEKAGREALRAFIAGKLPRYDHDRNDPLADGVSRLSPYLHFGQLSAQRAALEVDRDASEPGASAFLEQLLIRRELAENFCFYCPDYDSAAGFSAWAAASHAAHAHDRREYRYGLDALEAARTHDDLWNAAQLEMVRTGWMHGYLRMYWAKKILEWSTSPEEALRAAVFLNDRYQLDGRDPNGYAGIMWSVGGVHDRPWPPRPVFGRIRSMTYRGCRAKFDVDRYVARVGAG